MLLLFQISIHKFPAIISLLVISDLTPEVLDVVTEVVTNVVRRHLKKKIWIKFLRKKRKMKTFSLGFVLFVLTAAGAINVTNTTTGRT